MRNLQPRVSIGVPVFNGEKYLPNALTTLLSQDFDDFELIISDNASTDRTQDICRSFAEKDCRVRYFRNETNVGLAANHNRTFELSRGRFFKWAAHDDDFPRSMLSRFVDVFEESAPDVTVVYSNCEYIDESGTVVGIDSDNVDKNDPCPHKRLWHLLRHVHMYNSMYGLIRSDVLRKTRLLGRYPMSDHVLLAELAMLGVLVKIPEPLLRIRRHPGRTFTANKTPEALRELFAPGENHRFSRVSLKTRMEIELVRSAWRIPTAAKDKLFCTTVAILKPQWEAFRAYGGWQKRRVFQMFSSARPAFRSGDLVEILRKDEILKTLDKNGQLDGMPFMPEMFAYCGKIVRVYQRAHKTCDRVNGHKARRMKDAVHLEGLRCKGQYHGGCEASCLIFWKTAWLRSLSRWDAEARVARRGAGEGRNNGIELCTEADILAGTHTLVAGDNDPAYVCQATRVQAATQPLSRWALKQYIEDYTSGNVRLARIARSVTYKTYRTCLVTLGIGIGAPLVWLYHTFQSLRGSVPFPHRHSMVVAAERGLATGLDLQPGEWVRVKSRDRILGTSDERNTNCGMTFHKEMVPYCGGIYRVLKRVTRVINERTGKMQEVKTPWIILEDVVCQAQFGECRLFCPRSMYPYWREIWLERVGPQIPTNGESQNQ